ncbi:MAG: 4Fe-4S dicluster domain-containing protein, partial [Chitinophagales bacterium]|nr:4Fe-4S dicluster domain-containing protein [Chitinophagales bacterium]
IEGSYFDYVKSYWGSEVLSRSKMSNVDQLWDITVHDGVQITDVPDASISSNFGNISAAGITILRNTGNKGAFQLHAYQKVTIGDGTIVDNPWIQETPDPISKITWDNYILANAAWVEENGLSPDLNTKEFQNIIIKANNVSVELPVVPQPGQPKGTFSIAHGYGRKVSGKAGENVGKSIAGMCDDNFYNLNVTWEKGNGSKGMGATQTHFSITHQGLGGEKTRNIVKETTLGAYQAYEKTEEKPFSPGNEDREFVVHHLQTIYPEHEYLNHHWALGVDLNTCTGCSACVVACNAENNVPVVGRKEVQRAHEMHWMRIDKYYTGDEENPDVIYQPMMCQHCDAAPCENVCPVSATNHSSEGLNQMAYNRCFGTRYCANNCPYKVRRFNWYDYQGADSFYENTVFDNYNQSVLSNLEYSEPLSRMVMNPDVTVRSRGVMEKCSFCVQRIQDGKLTAKSEGRKLKDGDVKTACQTACPADAIYFGDINDKSSRVHEMAHDSRAFRVIEEIHTLPSVYYLTKVRNKPEVEKA